MLSPLIQVAIGGALGAVARFAVGQALMREGEAFPIGVLAANIIGCFAMGALALWLHQRQLEHLSPLLMAGILGGFTTFSAFSLEALTLYERGEAGQAVVYVVLSVAGSLIAIAMGGALVRAMTA